MRPIFVLLPFWLGSTEIPTENLKILLKIEILPLAEINTIASGLWLRSMCSVYFHRLNLRYGLISGGSGGGFSRKIHDSRSKFHAEFESELGIQRKPSLEAQNAPIRVWVGSARKVLPLRVDHI